MKKALPFALLGVAGLLFCFGAAALAYNFVGPRSADVDMSRWVPPQDQVDTKKINPAVALTILAGTSDDNSVDDSLAAGDFEGAFAQIAYGNEFSDANRIGTLLLLGNRYAAGKQIAKAAWMFEYASFVATVSPLPSDLNRAQALLEVAQGFKSINMEAKARAALDQAYLIAQYSFSMPRDTRAQVLEQVSRMYRAFGVPSLAAEAHSKSMSTVTLTKEDAVNTWRRPFALKVTAPPANPELVAKLKERVLAARELVDALNLNAPITPENMPEELISALGDKLYEEDGLRTDYYASQYDQATDASAQLGILRDKLVWLAMKYRIARQGFGISLVREWEDSAPEIAQELNDTYSDYFAITEQQAANLEKTDEADRSTEDVIRSAIVAGRWGLYPQYDETDLRTRLDDISQTLRDEQVPTLRLDTFQRGSEIVYLLIPDELYGMGERALPR